MNIILQNRNLLRKFIFRTSLMSESIKSPLLSFFFLYRAKMRSWSLLVICWLLNWNVLAAAAETKKEEEELAISDEDIIQEVVGRANLQSQKDLQEQG